MENTESQEPPPRAARRVWTEDDAVRVDAALTKTKGLTTHAAIMLGITREDIKTIQKKFSWLNTKWGRVEKGIPEGDAGEIDRQPALPVIDPALEKAAQAISAQDKLLQTGWKKVGFDKNQVLFLKNLQTMYTGNFRSTLELTNGGMIHAYTRLLFVMEDLTKKIKEIDDNPEKFSRMHQTEFGLNEVKGPHEFRNELMGRLLQVSAELRKVNSAATQATFVRAQIEKMQTDANAAGSKIRKKPGWGAGAEKPIDVTTHDTAEPECSPDAGRANHAGPDTAEAPEENQCTDSG